MVKNPKSFFEKLTGGSIDDEEEDEDYEIKDNSEESLEREEVLKNEEEKEESEKKDWLNEEDVGQLTVDMYQTPNYVVIETMVAGVRPEDLDVSITQDMVTIKGFRERKEKISDKDFFYNELYWGSFARSLILPQEVDTEKAEASLKNGLLVIKLPKITKEKVQKLKIKINN